MRLLLDTHVFLWFLAGDRRLSAGFRDAICDPANEVYLSVASIWEAVVKSSLGKLPLPASPEIYLPRERERHRINNLSIEEATILHLATLPALHRDPFDRIIVAHALQHDLELLSADAAVRAYPVKLFGSA